MAFSSVWIHIYTVKVLQLAIHEVLDDFGTVLLFRFWMNLWSNHAMQISGRQMPIDIGPSDFDNAQGCHHHSFFNQVNHGGSLTSFIANIWTP